MLRLIYAVLWPMIRLAVWDKPLIRLISHLVSKLTDGLLQPD